MLPTNKTDWMRDQMKHEPSKQYAEELYKIVENYEYTSALEIGCMWGISTLAILLAGNGKLLSVDPVAQSNPEMHARQEVETNGLKDRWQWFEGRSEDYWNQSIDKFDLIYIDGDHSYETFKLDIYRAWLHLEYQGILIADDYNHKKNLTGEYGIAVALWEFINDYRIEDIETTERFVVIQKVSDGRP